MTIAKILASIIELFNQNVDPDIDAKELVKTIQRANEFSARFTRIHLYQLQRQLYDLKQNILVNSEQNHCETLAARVLALRNNILRALKIIYNSLRRYLWGQPVLALLDLLIQSMETCRLLPSAGSAKEVGLLCHDDIPALCTKLKNIIIIYQRRVEEIVRENEFYESPRSYWKMSRKSHSKENIVKSENSKKHQKYENYMPTLKPTVKRPKSFYNHNTRNVISDGSLDYNENEKRNQSDREHDNDACQINTQISARLSKVEPDKNSSEQENQQVDDAELLKSATPVDGGVASAHLVGQHSASHVRSQVRGSNVLLVCIEESQEQGSSDGTRCQAGLESDSGPLWRLIGQASDNILEEMLQSCMKELRLEGVMSQWLDEINTQSEQDK